MNNWIFISKDGQDPFINQFAAGCKSPTVSTTEFNYSDSTDPLVFRGILKKRIIKQCWEDNRDFYYMDTGYFGNEITRENPNGFKLWHRIVKNNLQHNEIITRPDDRWKKFGKKLHPWKKSGRKIIIAKPDGKPCKFYDINLEEWTENVISTIKKYTDRPIEIRERAPNRIDRTVSNTLKEALDDDVFALVTYNSVAATEAVMYGIPAFTLAPSNAAIPVTSQDLSKIDTPYYPTQDKMYAWASHLAYGQFHMQELKTGNAKKLLEELW